MARPPAALLLAGLASLVPRTGSALAELTVPPNGISSCSVLVAGGGGLMNDPADFLVMTPEPDRREVTVAATASGGNSFPGLYEGSFEYSCLLAGTGTLEYGSASGTLTLDASSMPDALEPAPGNTNDPFRNDGKARGEALLELKFVDSGTVVSNVLDDGTPVQLDFTFVLESTAVAVGPPLGPLLGATATYFPKARDPTSGATAEWILSGSEQVTRSLDTQIGRTIDLEGSLRLYVVGLAGREFAGFPYYQQAQASIDAANSSHFTLELPDDVGFVTESGHDYTSAPAPGGALLLATGALVLAALRRGRALAGDIAGSPLEQASRPRGWDDGHEDALHPRARSAVPQGDGDLA